MRLKELGDRSLLHKGHLSLGVPRQERGRQAGSPRSPGHSTPLPSLRSTYLERRSTLQKNTTVLPSDQFLSRRLLSAKTTSHTQQRNRRPSLQTHTVSLQLALLIHLPASPRPARALGLDLHQGPPLASCPGRRSSGVTVRPQDADRDRATVWTLARASSLPCFATVTLVTRLSSIATEGLAC